MRRAPVPLALSALAQSTLVSPALVSTALVSTALVSAASMAPACALAMPVPAVAAPVVEAVPPSPGDPRIVTLRWRDNAVVRLTGRAGVEAAIMLGPDEHIDNIAIGDANAWQITPNKRADMLFVKPLAARAHTNLTVVTDARAYFFDLVATPEARVVYALRFTYPDAPKPVPRPAALTPEETALAGHDPVSIPTDPAALDFGWRISGAGALAPARVFADAHDTYIAWSRNTALPAILIRDAHGAEGPVNFSVRGDTIVVDGVPDAIVLRSGKAVAILEHVPSEHRPSEHRPPKHLPAGHEP